MVLIALLLVALVCLALGLVLASGAWLVGSLVASAFAAIVLWRVRGQLVGSARRRDTAQPAPEDVDHAGEPGPDSPVWVIDGRPRYHRASCSIVGGDDAEQVPYAQALADGFVACPSCLPALAGHAADTGGSVAGTDAELPGQPGPGDAQPGRSADAPAGQVWVVDGRPRYHAADCMIIEGQPAQAIPLAQATEDGFMPCSLCEPAAVRLS